MRIGAALSTDPDPAKAGAEAARVAGSRLDGADASLALMVASRHHAPSAASVLDAVRRAASPERVMGCVAETVVGGDREVEEGPAVAVWLASLPQPAETFHIQFVRTSEGGVFTGYRFQGLGSGPYLLIGDPFSFPTDHLLRHLNQHIPGTIVMGGMASGGMGPGETRLFLDDRVVDDGAVGARLPGVRIRTLVSQGCGPVGNVFTVTQAEGNVIRAGRPPSASSAPGGGGRALAPGPNTARPGALRGAGDRRIQGRARARGLPDPPGHGGGSAERGARGRGSDRGGGDHPVPCPGRGLRRRGSPRPSRARGGRAGGRCPALHVQRARLAAVPGLRSRRLVGIRETRGPAPCRLQLRRGDRPGRGEELLARLHGLGGPIRRRLSLGATPTRSQRRIVPFRETDAWTLTFLVLPGALAPRILGQPLCVSKPNNCTPQGGLGGDRTSSDPFGMRFVRPSGAALLRQRTDHDRGREAILNTMD